MKFAVFYQARCTDGKLASLLGSDSYVPIDGRYNTASAAMVAREQAARLARVQPGIIAYEIRIGSIGHSTVIKPVTPLPGKVEEFHAAKALGFISW